MTHVGVFVSAFFLSAFAGLASLLRSPGEIKPRAVASAFLNSGLLGLAISLIWYLKYSENLYLLIGICLVAGLGGMASVDYVVAAVRNGILSAAFKKEEGKSDGSQG